MKTTSLKKFLSVWPEVNRRATEAIEKEAMVAARVAVAGREFYFLITLPDETCRKRLIGRLGLNEESFPVDSFGILDWERQAFTFGPIILHAIVNTIEFHHNVKIRDDAEFVLNTVDQDILEQLNVEDIYGAISPRKK